MNERFKFKFKYRERRGGVGEEETVLTNERTRGEEENGGSRLDCGWAGLEWEEESDETRRDETTVPDAGSRLTRGEMQRSEKRASQRGRGHCTEPGGRGVNFPPSSRSTHD